MKVVQRKHKFDRKYDHLQKIQISKKKIKNEKYES